MNRRIVDGAALWKSDKIARIQPEWMRAEYANWIPLALANGVFESDTRRIWATIYSYNRPDISFDDAESIKREFCRAGLLFLWRDEATGKTWGYFTGIDKPGRLPPKSRLDKKHEETGPTPPAGDLRSYIELTRAKALDASMVSQWLANGSLGSGSGLGIGSGFGSGKTLPPKAAVAGSSTGVPTGSRRQKTAPGDLRHQPFVEFAHKTFEEKRKVKPSWLGKDFEHLRLLLKANASLDLTELERRWRNYLDSTEPFTLKQGGGLAYFADHCDSFADGPLLAIAPKGGTNGKDINAAVATTMRGAAINSGITH